MSVAQCRVVNLSFSKCFLYEIDWDNSLRFTERRKNINRAVGDAYPDRSGGGELEVVKNPNSWISHDTVNQRLVEYRSLYHKLAIL